MKIKTMRIILPLFAAVLIAAFALCITPAFGAFADDSYNVAVADENNLAANKYDWLTDKVGAANTTINENGIKLENFNIGGSCYAIYQTNKFNEFKYSMYSKLHLTRPSECGYEQGQYEHDYSNLYISFMINSNTPRAASTCPWNGDQAIFSICFENLQGSAKTVLYLNESFVGHGAERNIVKEATVNWNDDQYHWFEFEFVNDTDTYRDKPVEGKRFTFYFDGEKIFDYFQRNTNVYCKSTEEYTDFPFSETSGYLGYWTSSDFPIGAVTTDTDCYVDIRKVQITSYDNGNTTPYEICEAPDFDIEVLTFSPEASYEAGEEIEVRMSNVFEYEGDETLTYTVTCDGNTLGTIRNGYWVWTPESAGEYDIELNASVGEKTAKTYATIRVTASSKPVPDGGNDDKPSESGSAGCGGSAASASMIGSIVVLVSAGALLVLRKKRA